MILRAAVVFTLSAAVVALLFFVMSSSLNLDEGWEDTREAPVQLELAHLGSCRAKEQLESMVKETIDSSKACYSDDQCILESFGCPFGCRVAVNSSRLDGVKRAASEYDQYLEAGECGRCVYRCLRPVNRIPKALCVEGFCEIVEIPIPNLEELENESVDA